MFKEKKCKLISDKIYLSSVFNPSAFPITGDNPLPHIRDKLRTEI